MAVLIAYDAAGRVIATLDHVIARDDAGAVIGLVDFAATEAAGVPLTNVWTVAGAVGSGHWPGELPAPPSALVVEVDPAFSIGKKPGKRPERRIRDIRVL
jgi:hypothetical protein